MCVCVQVEFFGPLCDLVEGSLKVDVTAVDVSNQVDVPSLAELCVRNIHKAKLGLRVTALVTLKLCSLSSYTYSESVCMYE